MGTNAPKSVTPNTENTCQRDHSGALTALQGLGDVTCKCQANENCQGITPYGPPSTPRDPGTLLREEEWLGWARALTSIKKRMRAMMFAMPGTDCRMTRMIRARDSTDIHTCSRRSALWQSLSGGTLEPFQDPNLLTALSTAQTSRADPQLAMMAMTPTSQSQIPG